MQQKNRLVHAGQFMSGRVMSSNDNPERIGLNIITLNPNIFSDNIQIKSITNDLYLAISSAVNRAFKTKTPKIFNLYVVCNLHFWSKIET